MFSKKFNATSSFYNTADVYSVSVLNDVCNLSVADIKGLLNACLNNTKVKEQVINKVIRQRQQKYNNTLYAIIPQYHTSKCVDDCGYCSFRKSNPNVIRAELNDKDFMRELELILGWGYTSIEFVYSTDANFTASRIAQRVILAKEKGKSIGKELEIGINSPTLSYDDYRILHNAGVDFVLLWMETYSDNYDKWHPKNTPKSNFNYRIDTFDRSIQAGIKKYAFAVLFGLGNWIDDVLSLISHGLYLRENYGVEPYIIGNPRLKYAMGLSVEKSPYIIDDENYIFINYLYKLIFPETRLFINTRENIVTTVFVEYLTPHFTYKRQYKSLFFLS
ncbi:hypothetical protein FACS189427_06220 [Planctomycetales bacterium]|nr:hypothetical protein FACS189427_06220 [Planctomycetales bacterium]